MMFFSYIYWHSIFVVVSFNLLWICCRLFDIHCCGYVVLQLVVPQKVEVSGICALCVWSQVASDAVQSVLVNVRSGACGQH